MENHFALNRLGEDRFRTVSPLKTYSMLLENFASMPVEEASQLVSCISPTIPLPPQSDPLADVLAQAASLRQDARHRGMTVDGHLYGRRGERGDACTTALQQLLVCQSASNFDP